MEGIKHISQYRNRLDKTLAAHELTNVDELEKLVRAQMLRTLKSELEESIENIVEKRTEEVFNCVQMLKSTSEHDNADQSRNTDQKGWKLKQDSEEYRVMYREGPEGTPFHSLLVEGYVDGPLDVCLCIAWESNLYRKWWPQSSIPTFKILSSECLQKIRTGEQICLVRLKLSWPLSSREAVVHFFVFEYFQDDLIVVLFNSISDLESNDSSCDGYSKDVIPDKKDVIRIDVLGGMAMQKVSANRSYFSSVMFFLTGLKLYYHFDRIVKLSTWHNLSVACLSYPLDMKASYNRRTMANMDVKLDFLPPSIINFISRQLIGSGFLLYKKEVASVSKGDEDFKKALEDPMHCRIREALYSDNKQPPNLQSEITNDTSSQDEVNVGPQTVTEIEEVEEIRVLEEDENEIQDLALEEKSKEEEKSCRDSSKRKVPISPKVKQALETLEKAISFLREHRNSDSNILRSSNSLRKRAIKELKLSEREIKGEGSSEVSKVKSMERTSHELRISFGSRSSRRMGSNPYVREANHSNKIVPASSEVNNVHSSESRHISLNDAFSFHKTGVEASFSVYSNNEVDDKQHATASIANGSHTVTKSKTKHKNLRKFCCFHISSDKF